MNIWEKFISHFQYFSFRDNWHKHSLVSPILCWIGRHDYELEEVLNENSVHLRCFYCLKNKITSK